MSTAIYILDKQLNILIQRQYRHDLNSSLILESFKAVYNKNTPVISHKNIHFITLTKKEIILMSPVFGDMDIITHLTFLEKLYDLLLQYFKHYKLTTADFVQSDLVKDNFTLTYELFDECNDFGIPQLTEFSILKDYIKLMIKPEDYHDSSHVTNQVNEIEKQVETEINSSISRTAMTKISWRPKGIFYNKNEFFINFNEYLKFKYNNKIHKIVNNEIRGEIQCKSYLSGMPELKLGLNETLEGGVFTNVKYHQCVDLDKIEESQIHFIPPDGEFKLLSYQILNTIRLSPLILVKPVYRIFKNKDSYKLRIKIELVTTFKRKFSMKDVKIKIPLVIKHKILRIDYNKTMKFKTKLGNVTHDLDSEAIVWSIEKIQGTMRGEMMSEFELITEHDLRQKHKENTERMKQERNDLFYFEISSEFKKLGTLHKKDNIITVEFQLQNMLYSGLKVEFLTITEEQLKAQTFPWIMYSVTCKNDDYSFVLSEEDFKSELTSDDEPVSHSIEQYNDFEIHDFSTALDHAETPNIEGFDEYIVENEI